MANMRMLYWIIRRELPHTTTFSSLLDLVKGLGCSYLDNVRVGEEISHRSEHTVKDMVLSLGKHSMIHQQHFHMLSIYAKSKFLLCCRPSPRIRAAC